MASHNLHRQLTCIIAIGFLKYQNQQIFFKIGDLRNFQSKAFNSEFYYKKDSNTDEQLFHVLRLQHRRFFVIIAKFLRTTFLCFKVVLRNFAIFTEKPSVAASNALGTKALLC